MVVASTLASAARGYRIGCVEAFRTLALESGGTPDATLWFNGTKVPAAAAAGVNNASSDAPGMDDTCLLLIGHFGGPSTAAALATWEYLARNAVSVPAQPGSQGDRPRLRGRQPSRSRPHARTDGPGLPQPSHHRSERRRRGGSRPGSHRGADGACDGARHVGRGWHGDRRRPRIGPPTVPCTPVCVRRHPARTVGAAGRHRAARRHGSPSWLLLGIRRSGDLRRHEGPRRALELCRLHGDQADPRCAPVPRLRRGGNRGSARERHRISMPWPVSSSRASNSRACR